MNKPQIREDIHVWLLTPGIQTSLSTSQTTNPTRT